MADPNALTGAEIDRAADRRRRDPEWLAAQLADPAATVLVLGDAGLRITGTDADPALARVPLAEVLATPGGLPNEPLLLGVGPAGPVFAVDEEAPRVGRRARLIGAGGMRGEAPPQAEARLGLRNAAQMLSHAEGGLAAYAASLLNWHRAHRFCGVCGGPTVLGEGGGVRTCEVCATHHHPRTDPVVIMLVTDGEDRVLLGRQAVWPERRYSTLAGFVSPGESLEEAVAREVLEETGVLVGPPVYQSSQPWPFPYSLMLGFHVPFISGEIGGTDDELEDAAWFSREEVARSAAGNDSWTEPGEGDGLLLPPRAAIARRLIETWALGPGR